MAKREEKLAIIIEGEYRGGAAFDRAMADQVRLRRQFVDTVAAGGRNVGEVIDRGILANRTAGGALAHNLEADITRRAALADEAAMLAIADQRTEQLVRQAALGDEESERTLRQLQIESRHAVERDKLVALSRNALLSDEARVQVQRQILSLEKLQNAELAEMQARSNGIAATKASSAQGGSKLFGMALPALPTGVSAENLIRGGMVGAAIDIGGRTVASGLQKIREELIAIEKEATTTGEALDRMLRLPPVFGGIFSMGREIREMITGEQTLLQAIKDRTAAMERSLEQTRRNIAATRDFVAAAEGSAEEADRQRRRMSMTPMAQQTDDLNADLASRRAQIEARRDAALRQQAAERAPDLSRLQDEARRQAQIQEDSRYTAPAASREAGRKLAEAQNEIARIQREAADATKAITDSAAKDIEAQERLHQARVADATRQGLAQRFGQLKDWLGRTGEAIGTAYGEWAEMSERRKDLESDIQARRLTEQGEGLKAELEQLRRAREQALKDAAPGERGLINQHFDMRVAGAEADAARRVRDVESENMQRQAALEGRTLDARLLQIKHHYDERVRVAETAEERIALRNQQGLEEQAARREARPRDNIQPSVETSGRFMTGVQQAMNPQIQVATKALAEQQATNRKLDETKAAIQEMAREWRQTLGDGAAQMRIVRILASR